MLLQQMGFKCAVSEDRAINKIASECSEPDAGNNRDILQRVKRRKEEKEEGDHKPRLLSGVKMILLKFPGYGRQLLPFTSHLSAPQCNSLPSKGRCGSGSHLGCKATVGAVRECSVLAQSTLLPFFCV